MIRTLEPSEYPVLCQVADGLAPEPSNSIAIVAEDADGIIARMFLVTPIHMEGPWIREDKRGGMLATRLVEYAEQSARSCGATKLFAYAASSEIEGYLGRLGYKKEAMTVWSKDF